MFWKGDIFGRRNIAFLQEQLTDLQSKYAKVCLDYVTAKKKIKDVEAENIKLTEKMKKIHMTKFKYTERDIIHNRMCLVDSGTRRIMNINGGWTLVVEAANKDGYSVPSMLIDYKKKLKKDYLTKEDLLSYMVDKKYILEDITGDPS